MVKITDGVNYFEVTTGAYEEIYKRQGFEIVDDSNDDSIEDYVDDEDSDEPLSEWSSKKVKAFAKENGIDLTGTKSADEAKERINEFLNR
nr:MAG TPA: HeH/LEM domain [Caudoviricetes sp.]